MTAGQRGDGAGAVVAAIVAAAVSSSDDLDGWGEDVFDDQRHLPTDQPEPEETKQ